MKNIEITRVKLENEKLVPIDFYTLKDGRKVYVKGEGFNNDFLVVDKNKKSFFVTKDDFKLEE